MLVEGLRSLEVPRETSEIEAERIARRVARGVRFLKITEWPVTGDRFGLRRTQHAQEVYAAAAGLLAEGGVEIEVHQFSEPRQQSQAGNGFAYWHAWEEPGDQVFVKSIDGEEVRRERIPQTMKGHLARLYPPEEG